MKLVNLTPHPIVIADANGDRTTIAPSGDVARVSQGSEPLPPIEHTLMRRGEDDDGWSVLVVVSRPTFGEVIGLPAPSPGVGYIVSGLVLGRCAGRADVFGPDSGPTAIREGGQIVAVRGLLAAPLA